MVEGGKKVGKWREGEGDGDGDGVVNEEAPQELEIMFRSIKLRNRRSRENAFVTALTVRSI
eukprot:486397-Hanusia_phi.AAC.1